MAGPTDNSAVPSSVLRDKCAGNQTVLSGPFPPRTSLVTLPVVACELMLGPWLPSAHWWLDLSHCLFTTCLSFPYIHQRVFKRTGRLKACQAALLVSADALPRAVTRGPAPSRDGRSYIWRIVCSWSPHQDQTFPSLPTWWHSFWQTTAAGWSFEERAEKQRSWEGHRISDIMKGKGEGSCKRGVSPHPRDRSQP